VGWGEWGVTTNRNGVSFWGEDNVLEFDSTDDCTTLNTLEK